MTGPTTPALCLWPLLRRQLCRDAQAPPERLGEAGASPGSCCALHLSSPLGTFSICSSKPSPAKALQDYPSHSSPPHHQASRASCVLDEKILFLDPSQLCSSTRYNQSTRNIKQAVSIPKFQVQGKGSFRKVLRVRSLVGQDL